MQSPLWVLSLVLAGALAAPLDDVQENEPDWGFQSYLDEDYTITCNHTSLVAQTGNYISWELPNGHMLTSGTDKYTMSNGAGSVQVINMHMTVKNVQESDSGVYLCHVYTDWLKDTKRGRLLRGLNVGGHAYREPFEEYRYNLMVGGIAALVLFVPLATACFVYKYRFQTDAQKTAKHEKRDAAFQHQRYLEENGGKAAEMTQINGGGKENAGYENMGENTHL